VNIGEYRSIQPNKNFPHVQPGAHFVRLVRREKNKKSAKKHMQSQSNGLTVPAMHCQQSLFRADFSALKPD
jgi:hypothetical protein